MKFVLERETQALRLLNVIKKDCIYGGQRTTYPKLRTSDLAHLGWASF